MLTGLNLHRGTEVGDNWTKLDDMASFLIRIVREAGSEPLTGEDVPWAEETVEVEANSLWEAAHSKAPLQMKMNPQGRLLRFYNADSGEEVKPPDNYQPYRRSRFLIENVQGPYEGYTRDETWNGWAVPYFEFEEASRITQDYVRINREMGGDMAGSKTRYHENAFVLYDPIYDDEVIYDSSTIEVNGSAVKVYAIGTREWTWEEQRDEDR